MSGSYGRYVVRFLRHHYTVFHNGFISLESHQRKWIAIHFSPVHPFRHLVCQIKLWPVAPASHICKCSGPSCSTSYPVPTNVPRRAVEDVPRGRLCLHVKDLGAASLSWLCTSSAPAIKAVCGVSQWMK